jgi:LacI family transcriptional regulator
MASTPAPRATLRDIAARAGVTRMTVSLALRGKAGVSPSTRRKILRLAKSLGYRPDPEVSKLLARIRRRAPAEIGSGLALLTSGSSPGDWKRLVTERKYVEGATERAGEYGYRLEEFWLNEHGMTRDRLASIIWNRGIEGVIIAPLQGKLSTSGRELVFDLARFAAVEISETFETPDIDRSIHDQYTSMQRCLHGLCALGYQRIGFVVEDSLDLRVNGKWTAAFLEHRNRHGEGDLVPPLILPGPRQPSFDRWFERYHPEAVVSVDRLGLTLLKARGCRIPQDVGYASLDLDGEDSQKLELSGIDQNSHQVGAAAVDMLVAAIQRGQRGVPEHPVRIEVEGTWREGLSTRNRRSKRTG